MNLNRDNTQPANLLTTTAAFPTSTWRGRRRWLLLLAAGAALALRFTTAAAPFTPGNLAVLRAGDGTQTLTNTGNTIFIDEYTTTGVFVQSLVVPDSGANALLISGSASSEGALMRSPDGARLAFAGYNTNRPAPASLTTLTSVQVPRGVGTINAAGTYALGAVSTSQYSANNIRSGATDGINNFWGAGGNNGTFYFGNAAAAAAVQSSLVNTRVVNILNGRLYFSTASGTARGIYGFTPPGLPTAAATTNFLINAGAASSVYGFSFNPAGTIAYTADDSAPASGGGITRWTNSGSAWVLAYVVATNSSRGLVVDWSGANPVLYANTVTNSLVSITDGGAGSAATLLVAGAAGTALRGVAFAPLPAVTAPAITVQPVPATVACGGLTNFSVTATGPAPLAYQWRRDGGNITDATNALLTIDPATMAGAGNYTVVVANAGGSVTSSVAVLTIADTTAPSITTSGNLSLARTRSSGAAVTFVAGATDACAGPVVVVCTPASGSTFALGVTTVTCEANDGSGNTNAATFTVTVTESITPHLDPTPGPVTNVLGATTFINHGLVGVGHISASALDSFGETFGSMSGLQITGWGTNLDGSYRGTLNVLPDRGYNSGAFYADFAARINQVGFTFRPYYGPTNIGGTTDLEKLDAQTNQFSFGSISGVKFTYFDPITASNSVTTGLDPGTNYATVFGKTMPYVKSYTGVPFPGSTSTNTYTGINKLTLDAEALVLRSDGSGYVGDEYGANIYFFNPAKQIIGAIVPPQAVQPHAPTNVANYNSVTTPLNGRRNNQGFEGVSLSPDGTRLFALLQSSAVQDADAANNQRARNTRLLIYDVSASPVPTTPVEEYALALPTYKQNGNGAAADRTCAQSEIVALDNTRFLVLSRDGNGLGNSVTNPSVYKTVLLVDTTLGAPSNLAGDAARNAEGGRITTASGVLDASITPLSWVEAVNLLNTNQLAKFNVQFDSGTNQVTKLTMGEKWEGMSLLSANDPANPNDYFLFVGNDNDFTTSAGQMRGPDGTIVSYNAFAGFPTNRIPAPLDSTNNESDTRLLAYRITILPAASPVVAVPTVVITVTNRVYNAFRPDLASGFMYVDGDVMAGSPVRATQRALGYREVDYKSRVPGTLFFSQAAPTTNMGVIAYDYSAQAAKTNQVGFWVDKDVPIIIGPDGNAYITDGHHTTAGYLSSNAPVRQFVPGLNRVILGHIVANYYNPLNPQAPDDAWWTARAAENNAYLYGLNGNALALPADPNYASLQPLMPSVAPMPNTPSTLGAGAMLNSVERSLTWGLADGILKSSFDRAGAKIAGYKKTAPGSSVDINFVEFYWADFLRHRITWDNSKQGSPFGSPNGDASVTAAPLGFFAAVANGIALAKSEVYRDQYGRLLRDYTNSALFTANTVNWAGGSSSNGLAAPSNTFNLFLLDDSTIVGDITPTALATTTNILRINTTTGMTVTNTISNLTRLFINGGTRIATTWKDATVTNTTLTFPGGTGDVTLTGTAGVSGSTVVSNGAFIVNGVLTGGGAVNVWGGSLRGRGSINGAVSIFAGATLAPGTGLGTLTISGPLTLSGTTVMEVNKVGVALTNDQIIGLTALNSGGVLTVTATGDSLTVGDFFQLFIAGGYSGAFATLNLPALGAGLFWDTSDLLTSGTIIVRPSVPAQLRGLTYAAAGPFQLQLTGSDGAAYEIQCNTNLNFTVWTPVAIVTNVGGITTYSDFFATNAPQKFYRAIAR